MRKFIIIIGITFYLFVLLGLIFHSSAHPQLFSKYTIKYFIMLIGLIFFLPVLLWLLLHMSWKKMLILFIAICLLIVLPAELFLRHKYHNFESNTYRYTIDSFHPFLQAKLTKEDNLTINSLGFRSEEIKQQKQAGTYRIVVLGGSTVLNREVSFEKNAVRLLEKKLRKEFPDRKIEVINAGKDYYTSEHSLIQYLFVIKDLDPDLIIMWHGINDMVFGSCPREGIFSHGEVKSDYSHVLGPVTQVAMQYFTIPPVMQIKLVTADFIAKALKDNLYSDLIKPKEQREIAYVAQEYKDNKNTISVKNFPSLSVYKRNLESFIAATKADGVPIILGDQPSLYKTNNSSEETQKILATQLICIKDGKYYDAQSMKSGLDSFNMATKRIAVDNELLFVDLDKGVPKNLNYFLDNVHYTEKGNAQIAELLYNVIVSNELLIKQ